MTAPITIPDELAGRLERLAAEAGRMPQEILEYVMRDGFEPTERELDLSNSAWRILVQVSPTTTPWLTLHRYWVAGFIGIRTSCL